MVMDSATLLARGLDALQIPWESRHLEVLLRYLRELQLWNGKLKLVAAADERELVVRHLLDSLAPLKLLEEQLKRCFELPEGASVADAGSGNGMPGLPLALFLPRNPMTLIERSGRRIGFLENAVAASGIQTLRDPQRQVMVLGQDLQEVRQSFAVVLFRAFRPLKEIYRHLDRVTESPGMLFAYKGRSAAVDDELHDVPSSFLDRWEIERHPLQVPFLDAERTVVVFRRIMQ